MKLIPLYIISLIFLALSTTFHYSTYYLLINKDFSHQYFLITIYFFGELFFFLLFLFPNNKEDIIYKILLKETTNLEIESPTKSFSNNPNLSTNHNTKDLLTSANNPLEELTSKQEKQKFLRSSTSKKEKKLQSKQTLPLSCFIVPSLLDIISKFFNYNGIAILENDNILRCIIELTIVLVIYRRVYQGEIYSSAGIGIILLGLLFSCFYLQLSPNVYLLYFNQDRLMGVMFCIAGEIIFSSQLISQFTNFERSELSFYREVAWESLFGFPLSIVGTVFTVIFDCPQYGNYEEKSLFCDGFQKKSSIEKLFGDFDKNIGWCITYFFMSILYSLFGIILTKYVGVVYRASIDVCRCAIYLIMNLFFTSRNQGSKNFWDYFLSIILMIIIFMGMILCIHSEVKGRQKKK